MKHYQNFLDIKNDNTFHSATTYATGNSFGDLNIEYWIEYLDGRRVKMSSESFPETGWPPPDFIRTALIHEVKNYIQTNAVKS